MSLFRLIAALFVFFGALSNTPIFRAQNRPNLANTLKRCRETPLHEPSSFPPIGDGQNSLFITRTDRQISAYDMNDGKLLWNADVGGEFAAPPIFSDRKLFVLTVIAEDSLKKYKLSVLSSLTGLTLRRSDWSAENASEFFLSVNDALLYVFSADGVVRIFKKDSGEIIATKNINARIDLQPEVAGDKIFLHTANDDILVLNARDLSVREKFADAAVKIVRWRAFDVERIFAGRADGTISALGVEKRKILWKYRLGAPVVDILDFGEEIFVTSKDGFVYLLEKKTGRKIRKIRFDGRLLPNAAIVGKFVVLATVDGENVSVLDAESGKVVNLIKTAAGEQMLGIRQAGNFLFLITDRSLSAWAENCAE